MKRESAGFTLIEIMLVMVLLSMSAVAVVMTLPDNQQDLMKEHAQRFYYKLQLLNEDAILNGKDYGLRIEENRSRYVFMELTSKGWTPLENKRYKETQLDENLNLRFQLGSDAWEGGSKLFNQDNLFDEEMFAELEQEKKVAPPQLFVLSSGEVTTFSLDIFSEFEPEKRWQIRAKDNGEIVLLTPIEVALGEAQ